MGLATFIALAQLQGSKRVRVQRLTAIDLSRGNHGKLMVSLKNAKTLTFESRSVEADTIIGFAKQYPIAKIDEATRSLSENGHRSEGKLF